MGVSETPTVLIGELAARHGITVEAVRYYEAQGLLAPDRDAAGRRVFDVAQQATLDVVIALREAGLGVREVASVVALKRPGSSAGERLDAALDLLATLRADIDVRRNRLDRAAELLDEWRADARRARADLDEG